VTKLDRAKEGIQKVGAQVEYIRMGIKMTGKMIFIFMIISVMMLTNLSVIQTTAKPNDSTYQRTAPRFQFVRQILQLGFSHRKIRWFSHFDTAPTPTVSSIAPMTAPTPITSSASIVGMNIENTPHNSTVSSGNVTVGIILTIHYADGTTSTVP
jgi:hypothetical protein